MKTAKKPTKRIVSSGADVGIDHREDFETCPSCHQKLTNDQWDKAAVTLVLSPCVYKSSAVTIVSECPHCFEKSWVHHRMSGFQWHGVWPETWKKAVNDKEESAKLQALRDWGASLCWNCKHLESGTVEHHAWRHCRRGGGPAMKECEIFEPLPAPSRERGGEQL